MDFQELLFSAIGIVITGLATWATTILVQWLNSKIKNRELAEFAEMVLVVTTDAVKATYQCYVESLKGTDAWTEEAQEQALKQALNMILTELSEGAIKYIQETHGDVQTYLHTLIHSILYDLKKTKKENTTVNE